MTPKLRMTPLHWAAYHNDEEVVKLLQANGAESFKTILGNTPVDLAGFCKNTEVVLVFCKDLERKILAKNEGTLAGAYSS